MQHYLNFSDLTAAECAHLLARAARIKAEVAAGTRVPRLACRTLLLLFEKPSTRTRTSFITAMAQAGGTAAELPAAELQLARGEPLADTARVLSAYGDALVLRAQQHSTITTMAQHATCPVINGLSNASHPCQVLADVLTYQELRGDITGKRIAWIGDCNNVLTSWAQAAQLLGADLRVACPQEYQRSDLPGLTFCDTPQDAAQDAALVMTDVWASMGDEDKAARRQAFANYTVDTSVMQAAKSDAIFMHCLPAHRGEEVTAEVIDGKQSAVWQQAENRMHAQKALLLHLLNISD